jgi:zinc transport system ATP-binding protein
MKNKIIEINNLSFAYENQVILKDINLTVEEYDFMAILGPNGGGKTTLLKLINGLLKPTRGSIKVFGKEPKLKAEF